MNDLPIRRPNRLPNYNYSENGSYFITICTAEHRCTLWNGTDLSSLGQLVYNRFQEMMDFYETMTIDKFVVMPNHVHFILSIQNEQGIGVQAAMPRFVSTFKRLTNRKAGQTIWQRSYHDHVIRNEKDYLRIWQYIENNPVTWRDDCYFFEEPTPYQRDVEDTVPYA